MGVGGADIVRGAPTFPWTRPGRRVVSGESPDSRHRTNNQVTISIRPNRANIVDHLRNQGADPTTVKRKSGTPQSPFGGCVQSELVCYGPNQGKPCKGVDAVCDSSPGLGDGLCDACTLHGGVTTDDEMFIMLGSYYCEPGSDCAATITP